MDMNTGEISDPIPVPDLRKGKPGTGGIKRVDIVCKWRYRQFLPGAVLVRALEEDEPRTLFLVSITFVRGLKRLGRPVPFPCFSWLSSDQGKRPFFIGVPTLPTKTPKGIKELRDTELAQLRSDDSGERRGSERIYQYDVYNDLSNNVPADERAPWGGSKERPYPRR